MRSGGAGSCCCYNKVKQNLLTITFLCLLGFYNCSEMRQKKNTLNTVRQLTAKRRLERAKVELARAADALERFDKEQRASRPESPEGEDADVEHAVGCLRQD
jgi:hypothetical protein